VFGALVLFTHEEGGDLELGAVGGGRFAALGRVLDFAHGACEHGDDADVVAGAGASVAAFGGPALLCGAGPLARSSHDPPVGPLPVGVLPDRTQERRAV